MGSMAIYRDTTLLHIDKTGRLFFVDTILEIRVNKDLKMNCLAASRLLYALFLLLST